MFMDDLNVHSRSWEEHTEHLHYVLLRLREVDFKLNSSKCEFAKISLTFML